MNDLGKLKKVDLREVWKDEAKDFTPWLATEENLSLLSKEIGINIKLNQTEASVGNFSVDILAEEEDTGEKIVIENQLKETDHDHLGKLITYASGYDAKFAIWIVKDVRDEHKQAINWLNEHTDDKTNFFLIKIELWRIDNSPVAPKFQVISSPNDWAKNIKKGLSGLAMKEIEFLKGFVNYCNERGSNLKLSKPSLSAPAYYTISTGSSKWKIEIKINTKNRILKEDVSFTDKDLFFKIRNSFKDAIEKELNCKLRWDEMSEFKSAQAIVEKKNFDIDSINNREQYYKWLKDNAEKFQKVFSKFIRRVEEDKEV